MNLQLCAPYEQCVYSCPMCVARGHNHKYKFDNLYADDAGAYFSALRGTLLAFDINTVVLTGECDPTQNGLWVIRCCQQLVKCRPDVRIELQTHNFNLKSYQVPDEVEVLSYSITSVKDYLSAWKYYKPCGVTTRMVILLTEEFNFLTKDNFSPMGFDQVTFKVLQHGEDERVNRWVDANRMQNLDPIYGIMESRNGGSVSVRVDTSCQTAAGRYIIFRSDGRIYESWEEANGV